VSVRVNLLPREVGERNVARRARILAVFAMLALVAALVFLYLMQVNKVTAAQAELDAEEAERDALQSEVDALQEFAALETRAQEATALLSTALAGEVSFAAMLQDVALVMPSDADLLTLSAALSAEVTEDFDFGGPSFGRVIATGNSLRGHAPGLERLLIEFDKVAAFFNLFFASSAQVDPGPETIAYQVQFDLGPEVFTQRYVDGLPEELR